jgi:MYXO-CTERM domain-containing protein
MILPLPAVVRAAYTLALSLPLAALFAPSQAHAQCSGGAACPPCTQCRIAPASGTNPTVPEMATLFDRIASGPARYGTLGWDFGSATTLESGTGWCGTAGPKTTVPVSFPCILLKSIYVTESNWRQFCSTNQTVISFDCGYGIAQVTSGMRRGETSAYDAARVASSAAYNVSVGAAILAGKWTIGACVGSNDPGIVEHWYFATWGYNGFAFQNNPNNPMFSASRQEFRTPGVASAQVRGNYPYQELVWGYAHYPPSAQHYRGIALAYPNRAEICSTCGRPTAAITEPPGSHRGGCDIDAGAPVADAGARDAGLPRDAGSLQDATTPDDAAPSDAAVPEGDANDGGTFAPATDDGGGCGCRVSPGSPSSTRRAWWSFGALVGAAALRRRRCAPSPATRTCGGPSRRASTPRT